MTAQAELSKRTISGRIAVYEQEGKTSAGRLIFSRNSISAPQPLSKVKLLIGHDMNNPVGFMTALHEDEHGLTATFEVPEGEAGDKALAEAKAGIRDGLSVGASVEAGAQHEGTMRVSQAQLYEVSLVSVPAFENTLISNVTAQHAQEEKEEGDTMPDTKPVTEQNATEQQQEAAQPEKVTAAINGNVFAPSNEAQPKPVVTVTAAADRIIAAAQNGENIGNVMAALSDVVPADDAGEGFLKRFWVGQLWQASTVNRPLIELFGAPGKLNGLKAYGWKWDLNNLPKVGKYNSDKTAIPSNKIKTVAAEGDAQDFAAGWDIARKYIDLGATGYIEAVFQEATNDYRRQTDAWFAEGILEAATKVPEITTVLDAMKKLPLKFAALGAQLSGIQLGEAAFAQFVDLPTSAVPWWLREQGSVNLADSKGLAAGVSIEVNSALEDDAILAVDKRAATYYEHAQQPIRLQALDIPRGGIDISVHGYAAKIIHDPRAIMLASINPGD